MPAPEEVRKNALVLSRVRRVKRRLDAEAWLNAAVAPAWAAATGVALFHFLVRHHTWVAAPVFVVAALAWWTARARRKLTPLHAAAVIADRQANAGGLLLTRLEVSVGEWELGLNDQVRQVRAPPVSLRRASSALALCALFLGVALLVPLPDAPVVHVNAAAATKVEQLDAKADALAKEEKLDPAMETELARLKEELAENRFDSADWEAADGLDSQLEQKAAQAANQLSNAADAARKYENALANAQQSDSADREKESLENALLAMNGDEGGNGDKALNDALSKANGNDGDGADKNGDAKNGNQNGEGDQNGQSNGEPSNGKAGAQKSQASNGNGSGNGSRSQVSNLRKALEERQRELANAYGQQQQANGSSQDSRDGQQSNAGKSGDGQQANGNGQQNGEGNGDGSGDQSQDVGNGKHASHAVNMNGSPARGPGDNPLVFGAPAEMNPERLKFEPLPKGKGGEAEDLWGLRAADPKPRTGPSTGGGSGGVASGDTAPGNKDASLLPRNRELIKKYFEK